MKLVVLSTIFIMVKTCLRLAYTLILMNAFAVVNSNVEGLVYLFLNKTSAPYLILLTVPFGVSVISVLL